MNSFVHPLQIFLEWANEQIIEVKMGTFFAGMILTLGLLLPYWINGENAVIQYHDQLDGELLTYLLDAKHLFDAGDIYREMMNGIPVTGMMSPAPGLIPLFSIFPPLVAFQISHAFVKLIAFSSMYLLAYKFTQRSGLSFMTAIAFMLLPFYMVYGLCIPGQPMLLLCFLGLYQSEQIKWRYFLGILVYGFCSSLALVGFVCIIAGLVVCLIAWKKKKRRQAVRLVWAEVSLIGAYILTNIQLIKQLLGVGTFVSHRSEASYYAAPMLHTVRDLILIGDDYTQAQQRFLLPVILLGLLLTIVKCFRKEKRNNCLVAASCVNAVIIILVAGMLGNPFCLDG